MVRDRFFRHSLREIYGEWAADWSPLIDHKGQLEAAFREIFPPEETEENLLRNQEVDEQVRVAACGCTVHLKDLIELDESVATTTDEPEVTRTSESRPRTTLASSTMQQQEVPLHVQL